MTPEQLAALVADLDTAGAAISAVKPGGVLSSNAKLSAALFALYRLAPATRNLIATIEHLQAEVARLSTPPDDAEVAALVAVHRGKDDGTVRGGFHRATADALTRLSHALAAEKAKREAMEAALRYYADQFCEGFCDDMPSMEYTDENCEMDCGGCKARTTLAKHGSK